MSANRHNARKAAVQALYQWDLTKQTADEIQPHFEKIHNLQNVDKKYFRKLVKQIPDYQVELTDALQPFMDRQFDTIDPIEKAVLRVGAFELLHCPDVPKKVVLNEAIELGKVFGSEHSYKFINGVMDKLAKSLQGV